MRKRVDLKSEVKIFLHFFQIGLVSLSLKMSQGRHRYTQATTQQYVLSLLSLVASLTFLLVFLFYFVLPVYCFVGNEGTVTVFGSKLYSSYAMNKLIKSSNKSSITKWKPAE